MLKRSKGVWAVGKSSQVTEAPSPTTGKPVAIEELIRKEQEHIARYQEKGIIPLMSSPKVVNPEDPKFQKTLVEISVSPFVDPDPITTPLWLDPSRYGPLDEYTSEKIKRARQRGYESIANDRGYTTASINMDSSKKSALIDETPEILNKVENLMAQYIPGYTAVLT